MSYRESQITMKAFLKRGCMTIAGSLFLLFAGVLTLALFTGGHSKFLVSVLAVSSFLWGGYTLWTALEGSKEGVDEWMDLD